MAPAMPHGPPTVEADDALVAHINGGVDSRCIYASAGMEAPDDPLSQPANGLRCDDPHRLTGMDQPARARSRP